MAEGATPELQCLCSCIGHTKGVLSVDLSLQLELAVSGAADETVKVRICEYDDGSKLTNTLVTSA